MITITRERLEQYAYDKRMCNINDEIRKMARIALASLDAEPDYYVVVTSIGVWQKFCKARAEAEFIVSKPFNPGYSVLEIYTVPPASERERIRHEHAEWSDATFGDISPIGPLKHLSKEALEAAAAPSDLLEWADMQFLLWDAQRRAGITDEQITLAMVEKMAINKTRQWPEPKDGEPRLHIKEQPAPVVPDEKWVNPDINYAEENGFAEGWNACRAAMLQGGAK